LAARLFKIQTKISTMTQEQISRLTSGITGEFQSNFIEEKGGAVEAVTFLLAKIDRLESNIRHILSNPNPSVNDDLTDALENLIDGINRLSSSSETVGVLSHLCAAARAALDKAKGVTQNTNAMTQEQIHDWLLESSFDNLLKNRYKRDLIDVKIAETEPGVFAVRIMIYAPDCDTFLNLQIPLSEIEVVDNREVQLL